MEGSCYVGIAWWLPSLHLRFEMWDKRRGHIEALSAEGLLSLNMGSIGFDVVNGGSSACWHTTRSAITKRVNPICERQRGSSRPRGVSVGRARSSGSPVGVITRAALLDSCDQELRQAGGGVAKAALFFWSSQDQTRT